MEHGMIFTDQVPNTWIELQNRVCILMNQAGYKALSPCVINTVRGTVEVDVLVESPDELVKKIICECKFWSSAVPKEKVHAFRTVVGDAGASLGLLISKSGFQSGAIEAAHLSNISLLTWNDFTNLIKNKWVLNQLKLLKRESATLSVYMNQLDFPFELLAPTDKSKYIDLCKKYLGLYNTCWMITKTDLISGTISPKWYKIEEFSCIENYINFLLQESREGISAFQKIVEKAGIIIPPHKFERLDGYLYMFLE